MFKIFSNSDSIKNPAFITQWSIMHFSLGLVFYIYMFYFFGIKDINNFNISNLIHGIYEFNDLLQYLGWKKKRLWNWGNNSLINSIGDTLVFNIGWLIGYYIKDNINCNIMYIITIFYCGQIILTITMPRVGIRQIIPGTVIIAILYTRM